MTLEAELAEHLARGLVDTNSVDGAVRYAMRELRAGAPGGAQRRARYLRAAVLHEADWRLRNRERRRQRRARHAD